MLRVYLRHEASRTDVRTQGSRERAQERGKSPEYEEHCSDGGQPSHEDGEPLSARRQSPQVWSRPRDVRPSDVARVATPARLLLKLGNRIRRVRIRSPSLRLVPHRWPPIRPHGTPTIPPGALRLWPLTLSERHPEGSARAVRTEAPGARGGCGTARYGRSPTGRSRASSTCRPPVASRAGRCAPP
jgi:hypothetical protein